MWHKAEPQLLRHICFPVQTTLRRHQAFILIYKIIFASVSGNK